MITLFNPEYAVEQYANDRAKEARKEALAEGRAEGREEGRAEGMLKAFFNLVQKGILSVSIAAKETGMREDDFQALMNQRQAEEAEQRS